jgi:MYXO-CTERM domain-containing protein
MTPFTRRALATLCLLTVSGSAHAWSRTGGVWRTLPVGWYWNPATVPPSLGGADNGRMALEAGFATWASAPCTRFQARNLGTTTVVRGNSRDRTNTFTWISGTWPPELGAVNTVIGVTLPVSSGGANIDADIMFNNVGFTWSLDGRPGTVDAQSIAVHEEGHFLGLGHTTTPANSIMFPSYPRRQSRVMSSDDIAGVCGLYPGTPTTTDAGTPDVPVPPDVTTPSDPCNAITSCGECTPQAACGWCAGLNRCMTGVVAGPTRGTCPGGWAPFPMNCPAAPADAGTGAGTTMFGGPCRSATDCSSGGPCVSVSMMPAFCSQRCNDDCNCPRGYRCVQVRADLELCLPGTNTCAPPPDAAVPPPDATVPPPDATTRPDATTPRDAAVTPDATTPDDLGFDDVGAVDDVLEADAASDASTPPTATPPEGCGCRATSPARASLPSALALLGLLALRRRRRVAR